MADTKISGLTAATTAAAANELAINEAGTSKKISVTQLGVVLPTLGSYSPGTFTVLTGGFALLADQLILTSTQIGTVEGTGVVRIA
jgi:hypothetical protein